MAALETVCFERTHPNRIIRLINDAPRIGGLADTLQIGCLFQREMALTGPVTATIAVDTDGSCRNKSSVTGLNSGIPESFIGLNH